MITFSKVLKSQSIARDPAPLPVAEANQPRPRPRAALQADPTADMVKFAKEEEAALTSYAWVDRTAGVVQIPVERALEIVAERGLPVPPPLPDTPGQAPARPRGGREVSTMTRAFRLAPALLALAASALRPSRPSR